MLDLRRGVMGTLPGLPSAQPLAGVALGLGASAAATAAASAEKWGTQGVAGLPGGRRVSAAGGLLSSPTEKATGRAGNGGEASVLPCSCAAAAASVAVTPPSCWQHRLHDS